MNNNIIIEPSIEGKKRRNFTIVDNPLIDDITTFDLSDSAFRMLVTLIRYDGLETITFSVKTFSKKTGKKPRTIFALLKELEDKGYITREQRHFKTPSNLIRQTSSIISLEAYWDKVNRAQAKLNSPESAEICLSVVLKSASTDHKPASGGGELRGIDEANGQNIYTLKADRASLSSKDGVQKSALPNNSNLDAPDSSIDAGLSGVQKSALPNNSTLDAPDSSIDAGLDDVSRECQNLHSDKDYDKDINKESSDFDKSDVLFYVQSVVDFFNSLKSKYPDKIEKKVNRPKKQQTVETFSDKRYRAILKWYDNNIALPVIFSCIERWIKDLPKERKISGINYFENYNVDKLPKPYDKARAQPPRDKEKAYAATMRLIERLK